MMYRALCICSIHASINSSEQSLVMFTKNISQIYLFKKIGFREAVLFIGESQMV